MIRKATVKTLALTKGLPDATVIVAPAEYEGDKAVQLFVNALDAHGMPSTVARVTLDVPTAASVRDRLSAAMGEPSMEEIRAAVAGVLDARKGVLSQPTEDNVGNQWGYYVTKVEALLRVLGGGVS